MREAIIYDKLKFLSLEMMEKDTNEWQTNLVNFSIKGKLAKIYAYNFKGYVSFIIQIIKKKIEIQKKNQIYFGYF